MTNYETIREARRLLKLNGGLTARQLGLVMRMDTNKVIYALRMMGDAYIDRWTVIDGRDVAVYDLIETPQNCPKPERKAVAC